MARVYRLTWLCTVSDVEVAFGWHVVEKLGAAPTQTETSPDDVAAQAYEKYGTAVRSLVSTDGRVDAIRLREAQGQTDTSIPFASDMVVDAAGLLAGAQDLPETLGAVVRLRSGAPVRGGVGWFFAPPMLAHQNLTSDGEIASGADYGAALAALEQLLTEPFDVGSNSAIPPTDNQARAVVYSQRRRDRGLDPYYWDVVSADHSRVPRYLRSRRS